MGIFSTIANLFFPPRCVFCERPLERSERGDRICRKCRRELPYNEELIPPSGELGRVCAPLVYRGDVRESLHRYKFGGKMEYATPFGRMLADEIKRRFDGEYDLITWAPVSSKRKSERGYDQAMLLAAAVALALDDAPVSTLEKIRDTPANSGLKSRREREENVSGVYRVVAPELVSGKRVLLIDDIHTSGTTMRECARTLIEAGAQSVIGAALARTAKGME